MAVRRGVQFLATDIWDTPDDGKRYEVIDGELYVTPPPKWGHQRGLSKLHIHLGGWVYGNGLGEIVEAPVGVVLDEHNGVQPDLIYISRERLGIISERGVEGAPDLLVEVLSPSTLARDRGVKMRRYAAAGVPHYWQLDPGSETLEAYRLTEQGYELAGRYDPGSVFRPELFPGLEIPIDDLWR
ncbi:MAG TPA: Uma2 family endonuclease [Chloroflexota bacterium]|nr:Uma2 family endonuclease [Chloroflexota bacterium]